MEIQEAYEYLRDNLGIVKREYVSYKFGTSEDCKKALQTTFKIYDKTAKYEWLPEYDEVVDWMTDTKGKGLMLHGNCGRGKSTIITQSIPMLFYMKFNKIIEPQTAKLLRVDDYIKRGLYCIDEIGCEPVLSDYGSKYFPFMHYVDVAEKYIKPMFLSTNLTSEELTEKYDFRTIERILRLCRVVKFKGDSKRK